MGHTETGGRGWLGPMGHSLPTPALKDWAYAFQPRKADRKQVPPPQ